MLQLLEDAQVDALEAAKDRPDELEDETPVVTQRKDINAQ